MTGPRASRPGRRLTAILLAIATVCALGGCSLLPGGDSGRKPELTAWDKVLDMAGPEGEVGTDMALAAFSMVYGPVPGAAVPTGKPEMPRSGSAAIRWIAGVWDDLTEAQRTAVRDALGTDPGAVSASPSPAGSATKAKSAAPAPLSCAAGRDASPSLLAELSIQWSVLAPKIGLPASPPEMAACTARQNRVNKDKQMLDGDTVTANTGPPRCVITLYPVALDSEIVTNETLIHELAHCAMRVIVGAGGDMGRIPAWVGEGLAEWAAGAMLGIGQTLSWDKYLTNALVPLTKRAYDAVGFWFELTHLKIDVWGMFTTVVKASVSGHRANSTAAFAAAIRGNERAVLGSWPSSVLRLDSRGPAWNLSGPGLTTTVYPPRKLTLANKGPARSVGSAAFGIAAVRFDNKAEVVRFRSDRTDINGRLGTVDLADHELPEALGAVYCTRGDACSCPKDSPRAGTRFTRIPAGPTLAAFTAGAHAVTLTAEPQSLKQFCGPPKSTPPPRPTVGAGGPAGPDSVGTECPGCTTGSTHGDPHMVTFDGAFYDLQAAGEFTLTASLDDSLRVQTRQRPLGTSTSFGVNTAAAADVAGDRVGFYLRPKSTAIDVRINGKTVDPADGTTALPQGGTLTRAGEGTPRYTLAWPDGSRLYVTPTSNDALKIDMAVPPARKGRLNGLLGDYDGNPANDLDAGDAGPLPASAPPYDDLHGVFADHWRIRPGRSLFDYAPGESTETFTDRSFPSTRTDIASLPGRAAAEQQCTAAGVTGPGPQFDACVLDVAATGKPEFAESAAAQQKFTASARNTPAPGGGTTVDPVCLKGKDGPNTLTMVVNVGETVRAGGTGRLMCGGYLPGGEWRHHFLVSDTSPRTVRFTHIGTADCRLQWTVYRAYVGGTPVLPKVSVCQDLGTVAMPADTVHIIVIDKPDPAAEGLYGFTVT